MLVRLLAGRASVTGIVLLLASWPLMFITTPEALPDWLGYAAAVACAGAGTVSGIIAIFRREWLLGVPVSVSGALLTLWYVLLGFTR